MAELKSHEVLARQSKKDKYIEDKLTETENRLTSLETDAEDRLSVIKYNIIGDTHFPWKKESETKYSLEGLTSSERGAIKDFFDKIGRQYQYAYISYLAYDVSGSEGYIQYRATEVSKVLWNNDGYGTVYFSNGIEFSIYFKDEATLTLTTNPNTWPNGDIPSGGIPRVNWKFILIKM